jgi:hypothetical protein
VAHTPDLPLDARWQQLVTLIAEEFWKHNQHPGGGVFEPDRARLKLRALLRGNDYFTVSLTPEQVIFGDLPQIAREFYAAYRATLASPRANEGDRVAGGALGGAILGASLGGPPGALLGALIGVLAAGIAIEEQRKRRGVRGKPEGQ